MAWVTIDHHLFFFTIFCCRQRSYWQPKYFNAFGNFSHAFLSLFAKIFIFCLMHFPFSSIWFEIYHSIFKLLVARMNIEQMWIDPFEAMNVIELNRMKETPKKRLNQSIISKHLHTFNYLSSLDIERNALLKIFLAFTFDFIRPNGGFDKT